MGIGRGCGDLFGAFDNVRLGREGHGRRQADGGPAVAAEEQVGAKANADRGSRVGQGR